MVAPALRHLLEEQTKETARLHRKLVMSTEAARRTLINHVPANGLQQAMREFNEEIKSL